MLKEFCSRCFRRLDEVRGTNQLETVNSRTSLRSQSHHREAFCLACWGTCSPAASMALQPLRLAYVEGSASYTLNTPDWAFLVYPLLVFALSRGPSPCPRCDYGFSFVPCHRLSRHRSSHPHAPSPVAYRHLVCPRLCHCSLLCFLGHPDHSPVPCWVFVNAVRSGGVMASGLVCHLCRRTPCCAGPVGRGQAVKGV